MCQDIFKVGILMCQDIFAVGKLTDTSQIKKHSLDIDFNTLAMEIAVSSQEPLFVMIRFKVCLRLISQSLWETSCHNIQR